MSDPIIKVHKLGKRYRIGAKIGPKGRDNFLSCIQDKANAAMKKAIRQVVEQHKKTGRPLAIWENGKVIRISPNLVK